MTVVIAAALQFPERRVLAGHARAYIPLRGRVQAVTIVVVIVALVCAAAVWSR